MTGSNVRNVPVDAISTHFDFDLYRSGSRMTILSTAIRAAETEEKERFNGHDIKKEISHAYGVVEFPIIGLFSGGRSLPMANEFAERQSSGQFPSIQPKQALGKLLKVYA